MDQAVDLPGSIDFVRLGWTLGLVALALVLSRWQRLDLEGQIMIAVLRAFVQLIAIGYVLTFIFDTEAPFFILLIVLAMTTVAGLTSAQHGQGVPHARAIALLSLLGSVALTLGLLITLDIFEFNAKNIIPIAGMVIGNSMTACSLIMARVRDELTAQHNQIEAALALGASAREAANPSLRRALIAGMTPMIDNTKTVGLIQLPGAMTGMILAGAAPLEAVQLQIIVMYMLLGSVTYTAIIAGLLTYQQFFTRNHQLAELA
jgi:putative ABC transport system permease protein